MARNVIHDELRSLADAVCTETASDDDLDAISTLLQGNKESQAFYLEYCRLHTELQFLFRGQRAHQAVLDRIRSQTAAPLPSPSFDFLGDTIHGTMGFFSSGWPVAYLVATVVLGLGFLIGAFVHVSTPVQVVRESVPSPSLPAHSLSPRMEFVGRITGMVNCKWVQSSESRVQSPALDPRLSSLVSLGRKYALASGLMEITYDTGAKVILQGPCTYEVESAAGGFLSVGKLTARVESRESRVESNQTTAKSQAAAHSPLSTLHSPLFTIKTPTAIFTDLGTEFGVEVLEDGRSELHVLQGFVEAEFVSDGTVRNDRVKVAAGEAVRLDRGHLGLERLDANPSVFVRTMLRPATKLPTLMVADDFAYPDGPLDGNNGGSAGVGSFWSSAWFRGGSVIDGQVVLPESSLISRFLHPVIAGSTAQPIYFTARFTKTGANPKYVSCLQLVTSSDDSASIVDDATIGLAADRYRIILSGGAEDRVHYEDFGVYTPGQQVLIVGKLEFNVDGPNERLQAWINPTGEETADVVSPPITMDLHWTAPRCVHLRNWTGTDGTCFLTDLRIGYTWDAVVGPTNTSTSKEKPPMKQ